MNKAGPLPSSGVMLSHELKRYYEPLRLPLWDDALSLPYTHRSMVSPPPETGLQHWAINLQKHANLATPGVDRCHFRYSSTPPTAFPFWPQGRLLQINLRGYLWVHLRFGLLSCCLETHDPVLPQRRFLILPGRTDNSPDGTLTR